MEGGLTPLPFLGGSTTEHLRKGSMMWKEQALALPMGGRVKVPHCSSDRSAFISKSMHGVSLYCFRCGEKDFEGVGQWSITDILQSRAMQDELKRTARMPDDNMTLYDNECPAYARLWTLRAGIGPETASDAYGMRWSPKFERVFLPLREGVLLARAGRAEIKPKYLLLGSSATVVTYGRTCTKQPHVIVEDALSAIKVNRAGYGASAVLGTSLPPNLASEFSGYPRIALWLDADKAGMAGVKTIRRALALYPIEVRRVLTQHTVDPKYLTTKQIRSELENIAWDSISKSSGL